MKRLILLLKAMLFFLLVFSSNIDFCLSQEEECGPSSKSDPNANVNTPTTSSGTLGLTFNPTNWGADMLSTDAGAVWEPTTISPPGINVGPSSDSGIETSDIDFTYGAKTTLTATPASGYTLNFEDCPSKFCDTIGQCDACNSPVPSVAIYTEFETPSGVANAPEEPFIDAGGVASANAGGVSTAASSSTSSAATTETGSGRGAWMSPVRITPNVPSIPARQPVSPQTTPATHDPKIPAGLRINTAKDDPRDLGLSPSLMPNVDIPKEGKVLRKDIIGDGSITYYDIDNDGAPDIMVTSYPGRDTTTASQEDTDGDGKPDKGIRIMETPDMDDDGKPERWTEVNTANQVVTTNPDGSTVVQTKKDVDGDGKDEIEIVETDNKGNKSTQILQDDNKNGRVDGTENDEEPLDFGLFSALPPDSGPLSDDRGSR